MILRPAQLGDAPDMAAVDALAGPFPWSEQRLRHALEEMSGARAVVAGSGGAAPTRGLAGFVLFACQFDEGTILNIAVHPECQQQGVGRELLGAALAQMRVAGMRRCLLEVRCSNHAARGLYGGAGFGEDGMRKDYYPADGGREDAVLLSLALRDEALAGESTREQELAVAGSGRNSE